MVQQLTCPSAEQLQKVMRGELALAEVERISQHVETCARCAQTLQSLQGEDTLAEQVRAEAGRIDKPVDPAVQKLIERLRQREGIRTDETVSIAASAAGPAGTTQALAHRGSSSGDLSFLAPAQGPDELGRLGHYRVLQVLGQGGMGMVFLGHDPQLDRAVALKVMLPQLAANESAKQRFLREARAAAKLHSDHIVTIYQVSEDRGVPYLAMEFLEGAPLDQFLKKGRQLSVPQIVRIGREVARGLADAHERSLIHRDIKPGNIWLDRNHSGRAKILDFGLVRAQDDAHVTQSGTILGTPAYMAPEQARGEKNVDGRADLFSLGCVLYRLCCGDLPFRGETTITVLMALATHAPPPPRQLNDNIPQPLSDLIMELIDKDAARRPATARAVIERLSALEKSLSEPTNLSLEMSAIEASSAALEPARMLPAPPRRRAPARLLVALACLGLLALAGGVFYWQTNNGTVRIEINDADIQVAFDNKDLVFKGVDDKQELHIATGEHGLHVKRGGLEFDTDKPLVIKRGDVVTLRVEWLKNGKLQVVRDGKVIQEHAAAEPGPNPKAVPDEKKAPAPEAPSGLEAWLKASAFLAPDQQGASVAAKLKDKLPGFDDAFVKALPSMAADRQTMLVEMWLKARKPAFAGLEQAWLNALPTLPAGAQTALADAWLKQRKPAFAGLEEAWIKALPALPADTQVVLVAAWLRECNAAFDGSVKHQSEGSVVTSLEVPAPSVQDLTPLRALTGLKTLVCRSTVGWDNRAEHDVPGLRSLRALEKINGKPVAQFWKEALARQASFKEWLRLVPALAAKEQLAAVVAKLKEHNPDWAGEVSHQIDNGVVTKIVLNGKLADLSPLRALLGLKSFHTHGGDLPGGYLSDLTPLAGMKNLTELYVANMPAVQDLSPLKGMALTSLSLRACKQVRDLEPLKGMPLTTLEIWRCPQVQDLEPLKGMPLTSLSLGDTKVRDLEPLKGMPLTSLSLDRCGQIRDLTPLKGMPLKELRIYHGNGVTNLKPLQGMQLEDIRLTPHSITEGLDIVRNMKSLKTIGIEWNAAWPAAEFWARYDKGEFTKAAMADRLAAEYVLSIGGRVHIDVNGQDRDVRALANLPQGPFRLTSVWLLNNKQVTDAGLAAFADCTNVTDLNLVGTQVTDAGLAHFKDCKEMTVLHLENVRATDAGLASFKNYKNLQVLGLRNTKVTDAGLAYLKDCKNLTTLRLYGTAITGTGLAVLKDCKDLQDLDLNLLAITDAGLAHVKDWKNLQVLDLGRTKVSDAGLVHVKDCKDLKSLDVRGTKVSAAGIEMLKKALPKCKIEWDGGGLAPTADPQRRFAEWLLAPPTKGALLLEGLGSVSSVAKLPKTPFKIFRVDFIANAGGPFLDEKVLLAKLRETPDSVIHLGFEKRLPTDEALEQLVRIPALKQLTLLEFIKAPISDAGLKHLRQLPSLHNLRLYDVDVTEEGMKIVRDNPSLTNLHLKSTNPKYAGYAVTSLGPQLTAVELSGPWVTDAALEQLPSLPKLIRLGLASSGVTDDGILKMLKRFPKVRFLHVGGTKASEKILPFLTEMRELHLDSLPITDEGLKALHAAKQLGTVTLTKTRVTAEGVRALQKALPGCKIEADFPVTALAPLDPAWLKAVAAMKPAKKIEAVKPSRRAPGSLGRIPPC